jgi:catechol 2,3-dioxygenase-like lactoylglutathione lyase family enzyme
VSGPVSQVCYAVEDLDRAIADWSRTVGAGPFYVFDAVIEGKIYRGEEGRDTHLIALGYLGTTSIEFYQPNNEEPSIIREMLDLRGDGALHHIWPRIAPIGADEYERRLADYEAGGLEIAMSGNVPHVGRIAFVDAVERLGSFIEVLEMPEQVGAAHDAMLAAHLRWDGRERRRSFEELVMSL